MTPFAATYASNRQGEDAAGLSGGGSRFLLGVDRNESYEPNHPPGEPAGFHDIMSRLFSDKRNDPPDKPGAFVNFQSWR